MGFVRIGERPCAMKHKDGTYDSTGEMSNEGRIWFRLAFVVE